MTSSSEKPQLKNREAVLSKMPNAEIVQRELASAKSVDDFFGKEGIFARLFANNLEQLLEVRNQTEPWKAIQNICLFSCH